MEVTVDNTSQATVLEMEVPQDETELLAYFDMTDGTTSNALYINVELVD